MTNTGYYPEMYQGEQVYDDIGQNDNYGYSGVVANDMQ